MNRTEVIRKSRITLLIEEVTQEDPSTIEEITSDDYKEHLNYKIQINGNLIAENIKILNIEKVTLVASNY